MMRPIFSFIRNERAVLEPYVDILSTILVIFGFTLFLVTLLFFFQAYDKNVEVTEEYIKPIFVLDRLRMELSCDQNPDMLCIEKVVSYTNSKGNKSGILEASVIIDNARWEIIVSDNEKEEGIAFSMPVTISLNEAQTAEGRLIVKMKKG